MSEPALLPAGLQWIAGIFLSLFLGWVLHLIRSHRLGLRESLLWLLSTLVALLFVVFPQVLQWFALLVGVKVPSNALFALALLYLAVNTLWLTIAVSRNTATARRLAQECALLRAELSQLKKDGSAAHSREAS